ncbi:hypothetical protein NC653_007815 [Populus alba x Populus x berolinensis]|uniref:Retrovirus-related Pol polyprotein from transposon TNT 1-94-like beta-barrel domain-containing protein n=1 Tax=Populus alba x Populus x berolinensis TaxID=444605 RepID=A0AAD6W7Q5_9ROSI|nr:hypothetical protein NC653_007811 [Populus alba x Populus x berolinensis]KAJ7002454.1 hypothetical protein NC653_007815 [Populus alba x Populus x berolinensis]
MKVTWSDDLDSSSSDDKDHVANICFMAIDIDNKESREYGELFLDSASSRHIIKDYSLFSSISKINGRKVTFEDNLKGKVIGVSNIEAKSSPSIEKSAPVLVGLQTPDCRHLALRQANHRCPPRRATLKTHGSGLHWALGPNPRLLLQTQASGSEDPLRTP